MIILKLMGGLGNQMFQYAFGRRLQIELKTVLKFDITVLENKIKFKGGDARSYCLGMFNIKENFASKEEINEYRNFKKYPYFNRENKFLYFLFRITKKFNFQIFLDKTYLTEEFFLGKCIKIDKLPRNIYLEGDWAKLQYIIPIWNILKKDFEFKNKLPEKLNPLHCMIKKLNSVSVHIRRGDYVNDEIANKIFGVPYLVNLEYYYLAMDYLKRKLENPFFFIFSDDIDWCKLNFKINGFDCCFVDNSKENNSYEYDFQLMCFCKHNIISNSTYSWWAAYLNNNPSKIVITPKRWYNEYSLQELYEKNFIIPHNWIKI